MPRYANIRQLPSGRWQGRYKGPDGRTHAKTFGTARHAADWAEEQRSDIRQDDWCSPVAGRMLLRDWAATWQQSRHDVREATRDLWASHLRTYVLPAFGDRSVASIQRTDVTEWVGRLVNEPSARMARPLRPSTVHQVYNTLAALMAAAVVERVLPASPCVHVSLPKIERTEMLFLEPTEIDRLAAAIPDRYRAFVVLGCYGGLRFGELAGLERRHIDIRRGLVRVEQQATERADPAPLKTAASRRGVSLPAAVLDVIAGHLRDFTGSEPSDRVFIGSGRGRNGLQPGPLRERNFRPRIWVPAVKMAGLPSGFRMHDMRHTAVALWIATGAPPNLVSKRAGHTSVSFTLDRYGHVYQDADDALLAGLGDFYGGAAAPGGTVTPLRRPAL